MGEACGTHVEENMFAGIRWGKTEGKVTLRKPRRRWEDMMKMYLRETERENEEWMNLFRNSDKWRPLVIHGNELGVA